MVRTYKSLQANAVGLYDERYGDQLVHFRGIKYASIPKRFASPQSVKRSKSQTLQALQYGPRCPQVPTDVREIMQIPRHLEMYAPDQDDELECCNLNISCPPNVKLGSLPVLVWIHGGAQAVSFPTAAHRLGDPGPLVAQSIEMGKPIVLVTINFRLNIFAYGDGKGEKNLALQDQRIAMEWIKANISDFGGNPDNITLAGESFGAIHSHALIATGTKVKRTILASGNLYTSDTKTSKVAQLFLDAVTKRGAKIESKRGNSNPHWSLADLPAQTIVQALADCGISQIPLQADQSLTGWEENDVEIFKNLDGVMIGDCEFESILWLYGARVFPESAVAAQFITSPREPGRRIAKMYLENPTISDTTGKLGMIKSGGLDFISDARFGYPACQIAAQLRAAASASYASSSGTKVYQYVFDEENPWARPGSNTARAHHAVDLLAMFGGYDHSFPASKASMAHVGRTLRANWITFANGMPPWDTGKVFAYGPQGYCGELSDAQYGARRRTAHFKLLAEVGRDVYDGIWNKLAGAADVMLAQSGKIGANQKDKPTAQSKL